MEEHGIEVGLEEGIMWLPTHILVEACDSKDSKEIFRKKKQAQFDHNVPAQPKHVQQPKSILRPHNRANYMSNGGHGMQAVFLGPNLKPSGTGVFLPRPPGVDIQLRQVKSSNGADIQFTQPSNKPGGTPVLLPARVVQALNLNVHELGAQLTAKSQKGFNNESKSAKPKYYHKSGKKASAQCCVVSNSRNNSPEIFLPKEWTY